VSGFYLRGVDQLADEVDGLLALVGLPGHLGHAVRTHPVVWTGPGGGRPRRVAGAASVYVNHGGANPGLLLLGEAINLSESRVTQAETKEHFRDVQQVPGPMSLISASRLCVVLPVQKESTVHWSPPRPHIPLSCLQILMYFYSMYLVTATTS